MKIRRVRFFFILLTSLTAGAFLFGCHTTKEIEATHPPIGKFQIVDTIKLHYLDTALPQDTTNSRTVVLLHGASTSLLDFRSNLLQVLRKSHRVIAVDRPGLGYSDHGNDWHSPAQQAQLVVELLQQLGIQESLWIGHSWSGSVVLAAMLDHPNQVKAGVLLAGASHPWDSGVSWHVTLSNLPVVGWLFTRLVVPVAGPKSLQSAVANVFKPEEVPRGYMDETGIRLSLRPMAFTRNAMDVSRLSNWLKLQTPRYPSLTQPFMMITGTADTVVPSWNHAARLSKAYPASEWHTLEGAGHALHHSRTDEVAEKIEQFISGLSERQ